MQRLLLCLAAALSYGEGTKPGKYFNLFSKGCNIYLSETT